MKAPYSADIARLERLEQLAIDVRTYRDSAQSKLLIELFETLEAVYVNELRSCRADQLVGLQTSLNQCGQLRELLAGGHTNGRV